MSPEKNTKPDYNKTNIEIFGIISSWIVGPIVLALLLGSWLDDKYNHENFFTLTAVGIAFIITCVGIGKEAFKAYKSIK
jgi:hypothetical protein